MTLNLPRGRGIILRYPMDTKTFVSIGNLLWCKPFWPLPQFYTCTCYPLAVMSASNISDLQNYSNWEHAGWPSHWSALVCYIVPCTVRRYSLYFEYLKCPCGGGLRPLVITREFLNETFETVVAATGYRKAIPVIWCMHKNEERWADVQAKKLADDPVTAGAAGVMVGW